MQFTTPGPFKSNNQQNNVTYYSTRTIAYGGYKQGRYMTRVTSNPNTLYKSYNEDRAAINYGYGYPAVTRSPFWGLRKDITTNNPLSLSSNDIDKNEEDYNGEDN